MRKSVIVSAVRTPSGKFLGSLKGLQAPQLGAIAVREAVARARVDPAAVEECIMGNVLSAGVGQAPARQAALNGGLSNDVAALTINKVCGSGLKAVMLAAQGIALGDIDIAVAGGMESMSNAPYLLPRAREGLRMGDANLVDSMIHDGLWCAFEHCHMGVSAEHVVGRVWRVARRAGRIRGRKPSESRPCPVGGTFHIRDRAGADPSGQRRQHDDGLGRNDSPGLDGRDSQRTEAGVQERRIGDGRKRPRASMMARPRWWSCPKSARGRWALSRWREIVGYATSGLAPKLLLMTPVEAIRKLLKKIRLDESRTWISSRSTKRLPRRWSPSSRNWASTPGVST